MRKAWIIMGFLLAGANHAVSSEHEKIIPPGDFGSAQALSAGAILKADETREIVLVGTVTKIYPVAGLRKKWAVVVHVDRVVSGEFSGTTFTFTVHSPSRAGLSVRRANIIKAMWAGEVHVVDESTLKES